MCPVFRQVTAGLGEFASRGDFVWLSARKAKFDVYESEGIGFSCNDILSTAFVPSTCFNR